ncbi:MAG: radical SAM protein [Nitrospirae bacterium]|nr:radical SAM protein [Nitrospirota bacterium]
MNILINAHSIIPSSRINGPGKRIVVFFQGCARRCPGCFNPATHPFRKVYPCSPDMLFKDFLRPGTEGITVSGGDPFYQKRGLLNLLKIAKEDYGLSTVVYTGFNYEELRRSILCKSIFEFVDVLVDGRYEDSLRETTLLARGSTNQRFYFFSNNYGEEDFYMPARAEIIVGRGGTVTTTGFSKVA